MSEKHISRLINGEVELTVNVANRLEMVLGVPSSFWINLEGIYRDKLLKFENIALSEFNIFINIGRGLYRYVGKNYRPKS